MAQIIGGVCLGSAWKELLFLYGTDPTPSLERAIIGGLVGVAVLVGAALLRKA